MRHRGSKTLNTGHETIKVKQENTRRAWRHRHVKEAWLTGETGNIETGTTRHEKWDMRTETKHRLR